MVVAAGNGPDGGPNLLARASATINFTDQITFYGNPGAAATVVWNLSTQPSELATFALDLPTFINFGVTYPMSVSISDMTAAGAGEDENTGIDTLSILGFQVFGPACDAELTLYGSIYDPASCGPPINVSIHTESGFLYGGHVPEPSSLLLLATILMGLVARRSRYATRKKVAQCD